MYSLVVTFVHELLVYWRLFLIFLLCIFYGIISHIYFFFVFYCLVRLFMDYCLVWLFDNNCSLHACYLITLILTFNFWDKSCVSNGPLKRFVQIVRYVVSLCRLGHRLIELLTSFVHMQIRDVFLCRWHLGNTQALVGRIDEHLFRW